MSEGVLTGRLCFVVFFFKQKTAYEMRISDWSSDVCSSDLLADELDLGLVFEQRPGDDLRHGDVHAGQIAGRILEMPGRVGAAGAADEMPAIDHPAQRAVRRGLGRRLLRVEGQAGAERQQIGRAQV